MKKNEKIIILILSIVIIVLLGITFVVIKNNGKKNNSTNTSNTKNYVESNNTETDDDSAEPSLDNVTMTIKEGSLSSSGATVIITDKNKSPFAYYKWFRIEKKENGKWIELEVTNKDYTFTTGATLLKQPGNVEMDANWSDLYGSLEPGDYRIVKNVVDFDTDDKLYFACEFTIE